LPRRPPPQPVRQERGQRQRCGATGSTSDAGVGRQRRRAPRPKAADAGLKHHITLDTHVINNRDTTIIWRRGSCGCSIAAAAPAPRRIDCRCAACWLRHRRWAAKPSVRVSVLVVMYCHLICCMAAGAAVEPASRPTSCASHCMSRICTNKRQGGSAKRVQLGRGAHQLLSHLVFVSHSSQQALNKSSFGLHILSTEENSVHAFAAFSRQAGHNSKERLHVRFRCGCTLRSQSENKVAK